MLRLRAFGGLALEDGRPRSAGAVTQPKSLALLALLASVGERPISRDKVLAYLWPETEPGRAAHSLAQVLYALRHDLKLDSLVRGTNDLRLNPRVIGSDLQDFTEALERGDLRGALAFYQGPFLDGFYLSGALEFERWVEVERAEHIRKYCAALEALALSDARRGNAIGAADCWRRLTEADPLNSRIVVAYMEALSVAGGYAVALQFARDYERRLRTEFDTGPDPAVVAATVRLRNSPGAAPLAAGPTPLALAVLPFLNLTPDQENDYFSDGMTEELAHALARVPGLRVSSRTSAFAFKGKSMDARQIAEQLGVSALVEGSIRKVGNRIRLTAQLVNAADGCDLWSGIYERTLDDVFALQAELSQAIVAALPLPRAEPASDLVRPPTPALDAYTLYLRGRYSAHKRSVEGFALAIEYFEQAVEKDPGYALAYAGLAECWALRGFSEFGDLLPYDAMPGAKAAALEALRIDPRLPEAHTWLGVIQFLFDWDYPAAEEELRQALRLQPEYAYAETWYAIFLGAMGRHEQALQRILHAQSLEPLSLSIRLCVGRCYFFARLYQQALQCIEGLLKDEPGHLLTTIWAARSLCGLGRFADALELTRVVPPERRTPFLESLMAGALAGLGRADEARSLCRHLRRQFDEGRGVTLFYIAAAYARLGDCGAAMESLEEGVRRRDGYLPFVFTEPAFDALHGDARFVRLLEEIRLPQQPIARAATGIRGSADHGLRMSLKEGTAPEARTF
ncbi:MAG: BTAD domain-containing putative transcriptional regulator [Gemmatimonadales bacterium]